MVGSHAKWLPVAHATLVLFMSSWQSCGAELLSPQNVPETTAYCIFSSLSPSLMGIEDPSLSLMTAPTSLPGLLSSCVPVGNPQELLV